MPYSVVEEKLHTIPEEYLPQIMEYLTLLEYKVLYENIKAVPAEKQFERKLGILKGEIKIAPDFDTPIMNISDFFGSVNEEDSDKMLDALKDCSKIEATNEW